MLFETLCLNLLEFAALILISLGVRDLLVLSWRILRDTRSHRNE